MISAESLLDRLGAKRNGKEFQARCPAHDDSTPSLSIKVRPDKILLCCRAGCSQESILAALGIEAGDLFLHAGNGNGRIVAKYDYTDEKDKLLYQVVGIEPGKNGKKKDFFQRRPGVNGGWMNDMEGVRLVLYQLPSVLSFSSILICEGEKDCDTARKHLGLPATCNVIGAGKWRDEYNECLRGKQVSIIADADEPGRKHAQHVAASLHSIARSVKVLELPGAKDLTEWVERGGTQGALLKLFADSPEWKPISDDEIATASELQLPDMPESVLCGRLGDICRNRLGDFAIAYAWPRCSRPLLRASASAPRCRASPSIYLSPSSDRWGRARAR